eukprot:gene13938-19873_t
MEAITTFLETIQSALVVPGANEVCSKLLAKNLQDASNRLTKELVIKLSEVHALQGKITSLTEEHGEEASSLTTQVGLQDILIKELQSQVEEMRTLLNAPRTETAMQTDTPAVLDVGTQAQPVTFSVGSLATTTLCTSASQADGGDVMVRVKIACDKPDTDLVLPSQPGSTCEVSCQVGSTVSHEREATAGVLPTLSSPQQIMSPPPQACLSASLDVCRGRAVSSGGGEESGGCMSSLTFDIAILKSKYKRAVERIVELQEDSLKLDMENKELLALADMYRQRSELATAAHNELRAKLEQMVKNKMLRASAASYKAPLQPEELPLRAPAPSQNPALGDSLGGPGESRSGASYKASAQPGELPLRAPVPRQNPALGNSWGGPGDSRSGASYKASTQPGELSLRAPAPMQNPALGASFGGPENSHSGVSYKAPLHPEDLSLRALAPRQNPAVGDSLGGPGGSHRYDEKHDASDTRGQTYGDLVSFITLRLASTGSLDACTLGLPDIRPSPAYLPDVRPCPADLSDVRPCPADLSDIRPSPAYLPDVRPCPADLSDVRPCPADLSDVEPCPADHMELGLSPRTDQCFPLHFNSPSLDALSDVRPSMVAGKDAVLPLSQDGDKAKDQNTKL